MNFSKRLYSQLKKKQQPQELGEHAVCQARQVKQKNHIAFLWHAFKRSPQQGSLLPGPTVEFDARTADSGRTVDTTDGRSACLVSLDGDSCSDGESIHIQIKRAAVLSVKREESLLQQKQTGFNSAA